MSRAVSIVKIAAFLAVMLAPLVTLGLGGAVAPYGQKPLAQFPSIKDALLGVGQSLDRFGKALIDRSAATKQAIILKNLAAYYLGNFVDTETIIFGRDGWLFFKDEFICVNPEQLSSALTHLDDMVDAAKAAGLELIFSISPDKATIYPEYLHPLAKRSWACKPENNRVWRSLLAQHPAIIDHAIPILAEKKRDPDAKLFFKTDTHWTEFGASFAARQVIDAAGSQGVLPDPRPTGEKRARATDMLNQMLLVPGSESFDTIDMAVESGLAVRAGVPTRRTVVLHDSFYYVLHATLVPNFPQVSFFYIDDVESYRKAIAGAERIVVNSVERVFIARASGGSLSWDGPLGREIAMRCQKLQTVAPAGCAHIR
jgi:hypothetical protein